MKKNKKNIILSIIFIFFVFFIFYKLFFIENKKVEKERNSNIIVKDNILLKNKEYKKIKTQLK
jgi:hypothetical protein